jgi:putative ABC transport system substrate-binding protein
MPRVAAFAGIVILGALGPLFPAGAAEPTRMAHVGVVWIGSGPNNVAFDQRLGELGYAEGKTLAIDRLRVEGVDSYAGAMEELVRRKVDVIVTTGPEASLKAAQRAAPMIPIIMVAVDFDPVRRGYATSLARPGANITGVYLNHIELTGKRLDLLKQTVPGMTRVIVFGDAVSADQIDGAATAAQSLKLPIKLVELRNPPYDYAAALEAAHPRPGDALQFLTSPFFFGDRNRLAELALERRLPSMFANRQYADAGGLISYGPNYPAMYRLAAEYVDKILKGTAPADLPIEQPTRFELVINLRTAKALGLTIPQTILPLADEVIE